MNQKPNPALDRIRQIKSKASTSRALPEVEPFTNIILEQAAREVAAERTGPVENLPPLEEDQDEKRVAERLIALQMEGLGAIAPTKTADYNEARDLDVLMEKIERIKNS